MFGFLISNFISILQSHLFPHGIECFHEVEGKVERNLITFKHFIFKASHYVFRFERIAPSFVRHIHVAAVFLPAFIG